MEGLKQRNLDNCVNIILLADHGMLFLKNYILSLIIAYKKSSNILISVLLDLENVE